VKRGEEKKKKKSCMPHARKGIDKGTARVSSLRGRGNVCPVSGGERPTRIVSERKTTEGSRSFQKKGRDFSKAWSRQLKHSFDNSRRKVAYNSENYRRT